MKSIIKAFPYPILGRGDDYLDSEFQSTMDTRKDMVGADEHVFLDYSFLLSNEDISKLVGMSHVDIISKFGFPSFIIAKDCRGNIVKAPEYLTQLSSKKSSKKLKNTDYEWSQVYENHQSSEKFNNSMYLSSSIKRNVDLINKNVDISSQTALDENTLHRQNDLDTIIFYYVHYKLHPQYITRNHSTTSAVLIVIMNKSGSVTEAHVY